MLRADGVKLYDDQAPAIHVYAKELMSAAEAEELIRELRAAVSALPA